jgi:NAD+ synthase
MSANANGIVEWLGQRLTAAGARGFVVGLSGGLDSAVVARLCQLAAPGQVVAAIMPCKSDPRDEADAVQLADHFNLPTVRIDLDATYDALLAEVRGALTRLDPATAGERGDDSDAARVALGNVRPRLRMTALYFIANSLGYLVAGTGNRSELTVGYFTKHGDGAVDVLPIGHLLKGDVRNLASRLDVPKSIIDKPASAGLWLGQTDEAEMGFRYSDLEAYLTDGPEGVSPALALRIERMIRASEHKRMLPPTPEPS